jgi:hypothetical protein
MQFVRYESQTSFKKWRERALPGNLGVIELVVLTSGETPTGHTPIAFNLHY